MSHTAEYSTVIRVPQIAMKTDQSNIETHPNLKFLKRAMEIVISERGGNITNYINNNEGEKIPCDIAIKTKDFPRGVGIKIDKEGNTKFHYDAFGGYEEIAKEIENEVNQHYSTISFIRALKEMDRVVNINEDNDGNVIVEGVI